MCKKNKYIKPDLNIDVIILDDIVLASSGTVKTFANDEGLFSDPHDIF